jgi:hypothetical protein
MPFPFSVVCQVCSKRRPSWIRVVCTVGLLLVGLYVITGCGANNADVRSERTSEGVPETSARYETPSRYERAEPEACQEMGTGPTPAGAAPTGEYWFGFHFIDLQGETWVLLNGFPVDYVIGRSMDHTIGVKLNTALIGEGNQLTVRTIPALRREARRLQVSPVQYCGRVVGSYNRPVSGAKMEAARVDSAYAAWQEALNPVWTSVLRAEAAGRLGTGSAIEAMRDSVAARPFELAATFDNERGPDFSALFEEAPVITDTSRLVDYALQLRRLIRDGDGVGFYREVRPAVHAAARTDGDDPEPEEQAIDRWRRDANNERNWFSRPDDRAGFRRADVRVQSWSGGRVWEVSRRNGEALFLGWEVFVAERDGQLRVVRLE